MERAVFLAREPLPALNSTRTGCCPPGVVPPSDAGRLSGRTIPSVQQNTDPHPFNSLRSSIKQTPVVISRSWTSALDTPRSLCRPAFPMSERTLTRKSLPRLYGQSRSIRATHSASTGPFHPRPFCGDSDLTFLSAADRKQRQPRRMLLAATKWPFEVVREMVVGRHGGPAPHRLLNRQVAIQPEGGVVTEEAPEEVKTAGSARRN